MAPLQEQWIALTYLHLLSFRDETYMAGQMIK